MELDLHNCHRTFLDSYIKKHKLSFKSLENAINSVASSTTLSRITKKNKDGSYAKAFNVNLDTWIEIIAQLKLNKEQMSQAILLRVNDSLICSTNPKSKQIYTIIKKTKNEITHKNADQTMLSEESLCIADTYDKLPKRLKKYVALESYKMISFLDEVSPLSAEVLKQNKLNIKRLCS